MRDEFNPDKYHDLLKDRRKDEEIILLLKEQEIHVCARSGSNKPYIYYGKIKNDTIQMMYEGNHAVSDPNAYYFEL